MLASSRPLAVFNAVTRRDQQMAYRDSMVIIMRSSAFKERKVPVDLSSQNIERSFIHIADHPPGLAKVDTKMVLQVLTSGGQN